MCDHRILWIGVLALAMLGCEPQARQPDHDSVRFPAVFLDMDGTTLGPDKRIHPETIAAIRCYKANGGLIGIATGRTWQQVDGYIAKLKPNLPLVLYNGAVTMSSSGDVIDAIGLPPLMEGRLLKIYDSVKTQFDVAGLVLHGAKETVVIEEDPLLQDSLKEAQIEEFTLGDRLPPHDLLIKVLFVVDSSEVDVLRDAIADDLADEPVHVVVTSDVSVEVFSSETDKAATIEAIVRFQGYEMRDVLAIGDSDNDVEMLSEAGLGVAMENCRPAACGAASAIIGPSGTEALGKFIVDAAVRADCPKGQPRPGPDDEDDL